MDAIEAAGKQASLLTRKTQQRLISERNSLLKKYGLDQSFVEYMKDYFGTLYGKVTGKCPLYA